MSTKELSEDVAGIVTEQPAADPALFDPAAFSGLKALADKVTPLVQGGRFDNIVDLLAVISDNIEFLDEAMLEKLAGAGEDLLSMGWTTGNAMRMASAQTEKLEKLPGLFQLLRSMNDPDVRRSLHFFIGFMRTIGGQLKPD
ncbi:DUF1641 domain-containing protein [Endozoicomonas sp.]|uniref:DUF1641 domain-containing protein n=1 Tax=Endozoicomonas sp. TaxID=1892382 RepID=UPI00288467BC|nr:DUF1641 domain-containing protein [Endozoicomonas sp.]